MKVLLRCIFKAQFINSDNALLLTAVKSEQQIDYELELFEYPKDIFRDFDLVHHNDHGGEHLLCEGLDGCICPAAHQWWPLC